jgi:hypothetical protein
VVEDGFAVDDDFVVEGKETNKRGTEVVTQRRGCG